MKKQMPYKMKIMFRILKIVETTPFCNLFMDWSSYKYSSFLGSLN